MSQQEHIAIIGVAFELPDGISSLEHLENILSVPVNRAKKLSSLERFSFLRLSEDFKANVFADISSFDANFFSIIPHEAALMDPQQRKLIEIGWKAIENAGYSPKSFYGSNTGVFIGLSNSDYTRLLTLADVQHFYGVSGNSPAMAANRISYLFDFHGPSLTLDTACSSSIYALDVACKALCAQECNAALVGASNLILDDVILGAFSKAKLLSKDGICKTFSDKADGYGRGEGVICFFLKRLNDAIEASDNIYAVIRHIETNQNGKSVSLTSPNQTAQENLLCSAYRKSVIDFSSIKYIETHGTGTQVGDAIEIEALKTTARELAPECYSKKYCAIGSIKPIVGHLEAAAGAISVLKAILSFKSNVLFPQPYCDQINSLFDLDNGPFYILPQEKVWERISNTPRRIAISSFGFGGANAHIILEECVRDTPNNQPNSVIKTRTPLIGTTFQKKQYWYSEFCDEHPLPSSNIISSNIKIGFEFTLNRNNQLLSGHRVQSEVVFPAVGFLYLVEESLQNLSYPTYFGYQNIIWHKPLYLKKNETKVDVQFHMLQGSLIKCELLTEGENYVSCEVIKYQQLLESKQNLFKHFSKEILSVRIISKLEIYRLLFKVGIELSKHYTSISEIHYADDKSMGIVYLDKNAYERQAKYFSRLDACLHGIVVLLVADVDAKVLMPVKIAKAIFYRNIVYATKTILTINRRGENVITYSAIIFNDENEVLAELINIEAHLFRKELLENTKDVREPFSLRILKETYETLSFTNNPENYLNDEILYLVFADELKTELKQRNYIFYDFKDHFRINDHITKIIEKAATKKQTVVFFLLVDTPFYEKELMYGFVDKMRLFLQSLHEITKIFAFDCYCVLSMTEFSESNSDCLIFNEYFLGFFIGAVHELRRVNSSVIRFSDGKSSQLLDRLSIFNKILSSDIIKRNDCNVFRVKNNEVYLRTLVEENLTAPTNFDFTQTKLIVILGGAGGVGRAISRYLIRNYKNLRIIWIGRRHYNEILKQTVLIEKGLNKNIFYYQCDIGDQKKLVETLHKVEKDHDEITCVIYSAFNFYPTLFEDLSIGKIQQISSSRIDAAEGILKIINGFPTIQKIIFFSSFCSFLPLSGQSAYVAETFFLQYFSSYINNHYPHRSLLIDWSNWEESGVVSSSKYINQLRLKGLEPITDEEGAYLFSLLLSQHNNHYIAIKTNSKFKQPNVKWALKKNQKLADLNSLEKIAELAYGYHTKETSFLKLLNELALCFINKVCNVEGIYEFFKSEGITKEKLSKLIGVSEQYKRFFNAVFDILINDGLIKMKENKYYLNENKVKTRQKMLLEKEKIFFDEYEDFFSYYEFIKLCCNHFLPIITEKEQATSLIREYQALDLMKNIYGNNSISDYYNSLGGLYISRIISSYLSDSTRQQGKIYILELGAGTGAATNHILKKISSYAEDINYSYSDVSAVFLTDAQKRLSKEYDFLEFIRVDINEKLDITLNYLSQYHIITAYNVFHVAKNISQLIRLLNKICLPNGFVVFNELVHPQLFLTFTFGLFPGWWNYEEQEKRLPHSPLLNAQRWIHEFESQGFCLENKNIRLNTNFPYQVVFVFKKIGTEIVNDEEDWSKNDFYVKETTVNDVTTSSVDRFDELKKLFSMVIGVTADEIEDEKKLIYYGLDSLNSVDFLDAINNYFHLNLNLTIFVGEPSIKDIYLKIKTSF